MNTSMLTILGVLAVSSLGCSSSDSKDGGNGGSGGTGTGSGTCGVFTDLCSKVKPEDFVAACGASATSGVSTDHEPTDQSDPAQVSSCQYDGPGSAERLCFHDGPAAATLFYDLQREPEGGQTTEEDLTGVGDKAFYRETLAINEAFVYALKGELLVDVQFGEVMAAGDAKDCLTTLASLVLAAQ